MSDSGDSTAGNLDDARVPAADIPARREFLKATAAVTGASILAGCLSETAERVTALPGAAPNVEALKRFEHIVCVMFENRSLDNLLGYLYQPGQVPRNQTYDGLAGNPRSNRVPGYINDGHTEVTTRISPGTNADYSNPNPDPGEAFPAVNTQLFDVVDPPSNEFLSSGKTTAPYNTPPAGTKATMSGFVHDYCNNFVATQGRMPTFDEYRVIMDGFSPDQLPVLSTLAREFAVYDAWHAAVPTQTFCNRSFFHASASSGNVINEPYSKWLTNTAPTIFNRLQEAGISWKIYYDASQVISLTGLIHTPMLLPYWKTHFAHMEDFYNDMANGTLPAYAFVEPRMLWFHNDYHPPSPTFVVDRIPIGEPSDVRNGDLLLHEIYSAFRQSASTTGSNARNTLMLVTFDEHGGNFDHVVPPSAPTPYNPQLAGEFGFSFDRYGVRVPAIAISAHTQANTVISRQMNHAALIRTLCLKHGLAPLTDRDRAAPDLSDAYNTDTARDPSTWPVTTPRPTLPGATDLDPSSPASSSFVLNELAHHIVGLALARFRNREPLQSEIPKTYGEAYALLSQIAKGAFGPG